jgi:hypothetical protein
MQIIIHKQGIHGTGLTIDNNNEEVLVYAGKDELVRDVDYTIKEEDKKDVTELHVPWSQFPIIFKQKHG